MNCFKLILLLASLVAVPLMSCLATETAGTLNTEALLPVQAFAQLGQFTGPALSPDGSKIAHLLSINGRWNIAIRSADDPNARPLILPPSAKDGWEFRRVVWANNQRLLVVVGYSFDRGTDGWITFEKRTRETRLISVSVDGKSVINAVKPIKETVTGSLLGVQRLESTAINQDDVIYTDPKNSGFFLLSIDDDLTNRSGARVRKVNSATGEFTTVAGGQNDIYRYSTDLDGEVRLGAGMHQEGSIYKNFMTYKNPDTKTWMTITSSSLLNLNTNFLGFTPDPRFAYVIARVNDRRSLVKWDMRKQIQTDVMVHDDQYEISNDHDHTLYDETGNLVAIKLDRESDPWVYFDAKWAARMKGLNKVLPDQYLTIHSMSRDGQRILLKAESATEPGIYYIYDASHKTLSPYQYEYLSLGPDNAAPVKSIKYRARDGLEIEAFLTIPRGKEAKNLPTVILPHGGPWTYDTIYYDWWSQFLANRGYAVLQPNFRGSTGYGDKFLHAGDGQWGLAMQDDITDGTRWMIEHNIADPKRICIAGGSYGGYAALMGAVRTPDLFKCASSLAGVSDIISMLYNDTGYYKTESQVKYIGDRSKDRAKLEANSAINNIDKIHIPIQLVHAKDDLRVDINQSTRMRDKLKANRKSVEYVEIEKGEHFLETEASRITYLTALENFLKANIGN